MFSLFQNVLHVSWPAGQKLHEQFATNDGRSPKFARLENFILIS